MVTTALRSSQDDRNVADHHRQLLEDQIRIHANAILELKGRINNMTSISRLPPEILSEIFTLVAIKSYETRNWNGYTLSHAYKWIAVTHVCRTWRAIALNTPRLWSRIVLTRPEVTTEVLARSKKAPLWVSASVSYQDDPRVAVLETLMEESMRLRELHLTGPARIIQSLSEKWTQPAAQLEAVNLGCDFKHFDHSSFLPSDPISPRFFSGQTPNLRRLEVNKIAITWTNPLFCSTLKTLIIHARYDVAPRQGDLRQLLTALENMPLLETLQLNEAIPRLPEEVTKPPEVARSVTLAHLRLIDLLSDAIDCAHLLRHLAMPPDARLVVNGRTERGVGDLARAFADHVNRSAPPVTARLSPLYSSQIDMRTWRSIVDSHVDDTSRPNAWLSLDALPPSRTLELLLNEAPFLARLYRFEVHPAFRDWNWASLFSRMPELQVLFLCGHPGAGFLPALSIRRYIEGNEAGALLLPHLHTLELESVRFGCSHSDHESEFLEELLSWLILRCNSGAPILKLVLRECMNAQAEDVTRLREIVPEVQWDEREVVDELRRLEDSDEDELGAQFFDNFFPLHPNDLYVDEDDEFEDEAIDFQWIFPLGF